MWSVHVYALLITLYTTVYCSGHQLYLSARIKYFELISQLLFDYLTFKIIFSFQDIYKTLKIHYNTWLPSSPRPFYVG